MKFRLNRDVLNCMILIVQANLILCLECLNLQFDENMGRYPPRVTGHNIISHIYVHYTSANQYNIYMRWGQMAKTELVLTFHSCLTSARLRGRLDLDSRGNWWLLTELHVLNGFLFGAGGRGRRRGRGPTCCKFQVSIVLGGAIGRRPVRNVLVLCGGANELQLLRFLFSLGTDQHWMDSSQDWTIPVHPGFHPGLNFRRSWTLGVGMWAFIAYSHLQGSRGIHSQKFLKVEVP